MIRDREDFIPVVGFAREPAVEVRRWIGRALLLVVIVVLGYVLAYRVINPPADSPVPVESTLPAPI